jgi:hypothetical protein
VFFTIFFISVVVTQAQAQDYVFIIEGIIEMSDTQKQNKAVVGYIDLKTDSIIILWGNMGEEPNFTAVDHKIKKIDTDGTANIRFHNG